MTVNLDSVPCKGGEFHPDSIHNGVVHGDFRGKKP